MIDHADSLGGPNGPSPEYVEAIERIAAAAAPTASMSNARGLVVRFDDEIETMPPVPWLAAGIVPANALAALYGAPGAGKSFVALDLALSVTARVSWLGRTTRGGGALYLAAEGLSGLSQRIRAWKSARGFTGQTLGVGFVTFAVDLLQPATVTRVVDACRTLRDEPQLVVIDTLARSMVGDENDTGDMSKLVAHADAIRQGTSATVLLVHHTRKDSDLERGSSALRGAVDTLLLCREGDDGRELVCEKQKDAEQFSPIPFRLVAGHGSCVVHASGPHDSAVPGEDAGEHAGAMTKRRLVALHTLCEAFTARGATATEWLKAAGIGERTFFYARTWLVREGYVAENGQRYTATSSGRYAITASTASTANPTANGTANGYGGPQPPKGGGAPGGPAGSANGRKNCSPGLFDEGEYADLLAERDERFGMGE